LFCCILAHFNARVKNIDGLTAHGVSEKIPIDQRSGKIVAYVAYAKQL